MILLLSSLAWGVKNIAVLDFETVSGPKQCARFAEETVRTMISEGLDREKYNLYTKENLLAMIKTEILGKSCVEGACQIEIARNIGADYAITGSFYRISNIEYLSISLYETKEGTLLEKKNIKANTCNNLFEKIDISSMKNDYFSGKTLQQKYEEAKTQASLYEIKYRKVLNEKREEQQKFKHVVRQMKKQKTNPKVEYYPVYKYKTRYVTRDSNDGVEGVMADVAGSLITATLVAGIVYDRSHKFSSDPNSTTYYQFAGKSYHSPDMARAWRWGSVGAFFGSFGLSYTIFRKF